MKFIKEAIAQFKRGYDETVYDPFVVVLIGRDYWDGLTLDDQEILSKDSDVLIIIDDDNTEEQLRRIYGIIREHLLTVVIDCPEEIEHAARNISTGWHNYRLLF